MADSNSKNFLISALSGNSALLQARLERQQQQANRLQENQQAQQAKNAKPSAAHAHQQKEAATEFEAMLVRQMLGAMWSTVPQGGMLTGSREEEVYRDMLSDALSKHIAENQPIGIKDVILREMQKQETKE